MTGHDSAKSSAERDESLLLIFGPFLEQPIMDE